MDPDFLDVWKNFPSIFNKKLRCVSQFLDFLRRFGLMEEITFLENLKLFGGSEAILSPLSKKNPVDI